MSNFRTSEKEHSNSTPLQKISLEQNRLVFSEIMSNGKQYIVPQFQRDYSWKQDNWEELWEDIEEIDRAHAQHYMGYLFLQTKDDTVFTLI